VLRDGFGHHAWATQRLLDHCAGLPAETLTQEVPAIYGSVLATFQHLVDADAWYLDCITGHELGEDVPDKTALSFDDVAALADRNAAQWETLLKRTLDPGEEIEVTHGDGSRTVATIGVRLAQALHHGSDHRSQISTALTILGHPAQEYDVWAWGETVGLCRDLPTTT
jgi:uncharacterized damage-inducible protein DinB